MSRRSSSADGLGASLVPSVYTFTGINISVATTLLTILLTVLYFWLRRRELPISRSMEPATPKLRFRKREKIMFYGRKMLRRVRSFAKGGTTPSNSASGPPSRRSGRESRKRKLLLSIARRLLRFRKEQEPQLQTVPRELPPSLLEVDWLPGLEPFPGERLTAEQMCMLRNVRVLGHFEKPIFQELCNHVESRHVPAGSHLFCIGDSDDSIFVVQSGRVEVRIWEPQESVDYCVKVVHPGESVHSLLSILDVLTGHPGRYRTVSAVTLDDSVILRLRADVFRTVLARYPESLVRVVQIIMVRLQRVTFMALHNYLGLGHELVQAEVHDEYDLEVHSLSSSLSSNPSRKVSSTRDGRVIQDGPENEPIVESLQNRVVSPSTDGDDSTEAAKSDHTRRKKSTSRQTSEVRRGHIDSATPSVDFAAACSRARIHSQDTAPSHDSSAGAEAAAVDDDDSALLLSPNKNRKLNTTTNCISSVTAQAESSSDQSELTVSPENDVAIMAMATRDIATVMGLKNIDLLAGRCSIKRFGPRTTLACEGVSECHLFFVVSGQLSVFQQTVGNASEERLMYIARAGELIGALAVLTGEPSFFTVRAATECCCVEIEKTDFYAIMKEQPTVVLDVSNTIVRRMSPFVRQIDFALDWILIDAGRALYRQGEHSDCVYILLTGRLRSVVELESKKKELVGEYGRGELVGLVEVLMETERAMTMMAVRDTELAQIPNELLNLIKRKHPQVITRLIHLLGRRLLGSLGISRSAVSYPAAALPEMPTIEPRCAVANLSTVAVLPASDNVPLSLFTLELQNALNAIGQTLRLSSDVIQSRLGAAAFDQVNEYRLSSWLSQQEDLHRMVLYECDRRLSPWTRRCIRQADCILIVARADSDPKVGSLEENLADIGIRSQKELILLHREDGPNPRNTFKWLNLRNWCSSHHHIRCPKRFYSSRQPKSGKPLGRMSDFSRLARFLTGTSVGLVLGGGGARGSAHVGIIRALTEAEIPIDIIGGTSIGSFMSALWADETDVSRFRRRAREWSRDMAVLWRKLLDLTYPFTAMFSGASFNRSIDKVFGECFIEDLWIPYFCITTDLTASKMRVHTQGSLWRYVRASMTLSGYLPPLCDPVDGHLLLDGGYVNNLPADVMKAMGAQTIIAVDVGSEDEGNLTNYGDELSGWWVLWRRWWPWATPLKVPNMAEIQTRLAYVSCVRQLEQVRDSGYADYVRPPIDRYHTLQFGSFDEICEVGYTHMQNLLASWRSSGRYDAIFTEHKIAESKPSTSANVVKFGAETKFTDLAELVSRISRPAITSLSSVVASGHVSDDELSVTSEPPIVASSAIRAWPRHRRRKAGSEGGTSPGSAASTNDDDDDYADRARMEEFDDEEILSGVTS